LKRPFLALLALAATAGFGAWLVRTPNTQREILLACAGWVLGFWAAAAIAGRRRSSPDEDDAPDEWDEEEWEDDEEDPDDWDGEDER